MDNHDTTNTLTMSLFNHFLHERKLLNHSAPVCQRSAFNVHTDTVLDGDVIFQGFMSVQDAIHKCESMLECRGLILINELSEKNASEHVSNISFVGGNLSFEPQNFTTSYTKSKFVFVDTPDCGDIVGLAPIMSRSVCAALGRDRGDSDGTAASVFALISGERVAAIQ